ncbi:C4-dicarboxylate TRAP transporter substrate-binding protein [Roseibium alexandrii]|jgi:TRAP-type C4-dicarboxylate transport system substrate-binding protein|uniref:TRAP transporter solute receptor, DctP family n=1 Tax=Roseibium alexandrii TaxID=388408 RepID=A0A0M7A4L4_9HYPH|nr:C4-dicarboxylate TRAP transporter substrate-binding protein [Roseibium alexandrii]CTQ69531.1 TRAP transporter solute receptor, DctP family [Roseibium alexandrii]
MKRMLAALAAVAFSAAAQAETYNLTMASSHPTVLPWVGQLSTLVVGESNNRLEAMGSEDRIEWTEAYGGSLYGFKDTLEAVGDGLTDAGWVGTLWEGSKMPLQNMTYFTPFVSDDLVATLKIMNELHREVPALQKAWDDQNVVFLGASGVETYHLLTNFPVNSLKDLEGRKILAPGPSANWIKHLGAVPVNGALPTYYNQIQTGVADGMVVILTGAFPNKHYEVAPYVTLVGIGAQMTGGLGINKDVWDGLSDDVKNVLTELGEEYTVAHAEEVMARYQTFLGKLPDAGATVTTLPAEDVVAWADGLPNLAKDWSDANAGKGADEVLQAYMAKVRDAGLEPRIDWTQR